LVIFVNLDDYFTDSLKYLDKPTLIAPSYDTDLLALEGIISQVSKWIEFSYSQKNLHLEIRTKSSNFSKIEHLKPTKNITLTWSLSPQEVISKHEKLTANLEKRVSAINSAIVKKWRVRLAIDPILDLNYSDINYTNKIYLEFLKYLTENIDFNKIDSITFGTFRISSQHLSKLKKLQKSEVAFYPYESENNISFYSRERDKNLISPLLNYIKNYISEEKIRVWDK
jgi:spore photoproduct lyase